MEVNLEKWAKDYEPWLCSIKPGDEFPNIQILNQFPTFSCYPQYFISGHSILNNRFYAGLESGNDFYFRDELAFPF